MLDAAAVLHAQGVTDIQTANQAAGITAACGRLCLSSLQHWNYGTGLLAVPILAGSCAYALAETLNWPIGLDRTFDRA